MPSNLSIYIHWPFCLSKCPYCDFNSHVASSIDHDEWMNAYLREISYYQEELRGRRVRSIFFGGGTPSLMRPKTVYAIISAISDLANIDNQTEITLEANPTSYEAKKFKDFKASGVNRVSIGVQAFNEEDLKYLGRKHSHNDAIEAIKSANSIFQSVSFDLIYARSNQKLSDWKKELEFAMTLASGHISLYQLTIEKGTEFYQKFRDGGLIIPHHDLATKMYEVTNKYLQDNGYNRYEISNYAKPGQESKHNLSYWNYQEYLGIGPGAHSRMNSHAIVMHHKPDKWIEGTKEPYAAVQKKHKLSGQDITHELIMMGTRLGSGINDQRLRELTGLGFADVLDMNVLAKFENMGLVEFKPAEVGFRKKSNSYLRLTDSGLMLHSYIVPNLVK